MAVYTNLTTLEENWEVTVCKSLVNVEISDGLMEKDCADK